MNYNSEVMGVIMEELLVYALLLYEELLTESEYNKRLDELFLSTSENDDLFNDLLYLEWETDIKKAIVYVRTHIDYNNLDIDLFGKILMSRLKELYKNYLDKNYLKKQMTSHSKYFHHRLSIFLLYHPTALHYHFD